MAHYRKEGGKMKSYEIASQLSCIAKKSAHGEATQADFLLAHRLVDDLYNMNHAAQEPQHLVQRAKDAVARHAASVRNFGLATRKNFGIENGVPVGDR